MKLFFLSAFSFFAFSSAFAQPDGGKENFSPNSPGKSKYLNLERDGRALSFVYSEFSAAPLLNNYLDITTGSRQGSFQPYYMAIGWEKTTTAEEHMFDIVGSVSFILPQKVTAGPSDSLALRLQGWHTTTSILGFDLVKGEMVTLALAPAWSYGNIKMRRVVDGQKTWYTNPFVAPGARGEFRLIFGNFMIGARAAYRYDITHALWKRKDDMMPVMPEHKNTGMAYFGYIGLIL